MCVGRMILTQLQDGHSVGSRNLNFWKCVQMKFGSLIPDSSYTINGSPISVTTEHKDAGVMVI